MHIEQRLKLTKFLKMSLVICPLVLVLAVGIFLWALPRGLDFTDEGFYLLPARQPEAIQASLSMYYFYAGALFKWVNYQIIAYRLVGFVLDMMVLIFWGSGWVRLLNAFFKGSEFTKFESIIFVSFICLGGIFGLSVIGFTPSYNSLSVFTVYMSSGIFFYALAKLFNKRKQVGALLFSAGLFIGMAFFIKFSSSICLLGLEALAILCMPQIKLKAKCVYIGSIILGMALWLLMHFLMWQSPCALWSVFHTELMYDRVATKSHNLTLILSNVKQLCHVFKTTLEVFALVYLPLIIVAIITCFSVKAKLHERVLLSVVMLGFIGTMIIAIKNKFYLLGAIYGDNLLHLVQFYLGFLGLFILFLCGFYYPRLKSLLASTNHIYYVLGFLGVLYFFPYIEAIGTDNPIWTDALFYTGVWFALLFLFAKLLAQIANRPGILALSIILISIITLLQITSRINDSYRTGSLLSQTRAVYIGNPASLVKVDPVTATAINQLKQIAGQCQFKAGEDILSFYDDPTLVFALGGISPVAPWYYGVQPGSESVAQGILPLIPPARLRKAYILQDWGANGPEPDFNAYGINFPQSYVLCGEVKINNNLHHGMHDLLLWKPRH